MTSNATSNGPTYISSHSADVILSDIRPIKLKAEALRSINVLLDEFLYNILAAARSLSTDKLRAGLLKVLPTNLGKEALLEAEVELRAYWERTKLPNDAGSPVTDDGQNFHLQWSFELLRLKCEAYSTLNEHDENLAAENALNERMGRAGGLAPPKATLVAPAALYLTAILEAMCEHILSNVGRVASRDSSRTTATVQDLFVALCEDESIYGLFKTLKVYAQIESLSQTKSFSREKGPLPLSQEPIKATTSLSSSPGSRLSSEIPPMPGTLSSASNSRTSIDKPRGVKKFIGGTRTSSDEVQSNHRRSNSVVSDGTGTTVAVYQESEKAGFEDTALLQEFDDLMRSNSTMKVSLTPDRLRTMEVYKQEKDQRWNKRPPPSFLPQSESDPTAFSSRLNGRGPSLHHVDSIVEDDEDSRLSPILPAGTAPDTQAKSVTFPASRIRSASAATPPSMTRILPRKSSYTAIAPSPPTPTSPPPMPKFSPHKSPAGVPPMTRKIQKKRESLDLDDVMGGSDDELATPETPRRALVGPRTPLKQGVSSSTRDLMDFLAEGPPEPPSFTPSAAVYESGKSKSSGRLQRMMSKLSMGHSDKTHSKNSASTDDISRSSPLRAPPSQRAEVQNKTSYTSLSSLANRPIPPRPPPISPPESPSYNSSTEERTSTSSRSHKISVMRKNIPAWEQKPEMPPPPRTSASDVAKVTANGNGSVHEPPGSPRPSNGHARVHNPDVDRVLESTNKNHSRRASLIRRVPVPTEDVLVETPQPASPKPPSAKPSSVTQTPIHGTPRSPSPLINANVSPQVQLPKLDGRELRRLMANATNADECRLILDTVLIRAGIPIDSISSGSIPMAGSPQQLVDPVLENTLVELFLGSEPENTSQTSEIPPSEIVQDTSSALSADNGPAFVETAA